MNQHPNYSLDDYTLWRYAFEGGDAFINRYLVKYSARESQSDFEMRKKVTYCPAFAKAAITEVKNSIYQRMHEVSRTGGSQTVREAIDNDIDLCGRSLTSFMGQIVLPELLVMGRVGIYVDMPAIDATNSRRETSSARPYIYMYPIEDILNWDSTYRQVYLQDNNYTFDEHGFPQGMEKGTRKLFVDADGVGIQINDEGVPHRLGSAHTRIPFFVLELNESMMKDIARYQIALLNSASSDIGYNLHSNFPFYVEQYDARAEASRHINGISPQAHLAHTNTNTTGDVDTNSDRNSNAEEIKVGSLYGRKYGKDLKAPTFIAPPSEPLEASMKKQEQLKEEIRLLLNLSLKNARASGSASADSKKQDELTLESGLANIGMVLEHGEREIMRIWQAYQPEVEVPTINYPANYSLRSTSDRLVEADSLRKLLPVLPSSTYQRTLGKKIATVLLGGMVSVDDMITIEGEIDAAPAMVADPAVINQDVEDGICSPETAAILKCYPKGEHLKAQKAHAERLTRIALAQSSVPNDKTTPTSSEDSTPDQGKDAKETNQDPDTHASSRRRTRS